MTLALAVLEIYKLKLVYSAKQQVAQRGNNCSPESQLCRENILNSSQVRKGVFMPATSKKLRRHIIMPPTSKKLMRHISLGLPICLSVRPSVRYTCTRSRTIRDKTLKFGMWVEYEN